MQLAHSLLAGLSSISTLSLAPAMGSNSGCIFLCISDLHCFISNILESFWLSGIDSRLMMSCNHVQRHGLDVRMSQLFKIGEARPAAARAPAGPRPLAVSRPSAPKPPPPNSTAMLASASDSTILEHLDKQ